jgi:hypothetical protein
MTSFLNPQVQKNGSMGPNSGGGKRNKTKVTPARARFSNFCPHAKTKGSDKTSDGQGRKKKLQSALKSGVSASVAGAFDRVSQSLLASADVFHMSPHVADHVISILSRPQDSSESSSSVSESDDDAIASVAAPVDAIKKAIDLRLDLSPDHVRTLKPSRNGLSDSEICALQLFASHGFTKEDFVNISDIVGSDLIDICAAAVVRSCGIEITPLEQCNPSSTLEEELISLASIYGESFSTQRSSNGCVLFQLAYEASDAFVIVVIQHSDMYPSDQCDVAAWFYRPLLDRSKCVSHCRDALNCARDRCKSGLPILFDVFQSLEVAALSTPPAEAECQSELQHIYGKYKFTLSSNQAVDGTVQKLGETSGITSIASNLEAKSLSETSSTSCTASSLSPEAAQSIRIQYNKALNWADESGFLHADASRKAKERLIEMFPQYSEAAISVALSGKLSHSFKPSMVFNIQDLDFGVQLQCVKSIMKSIDVTKGKAKSLLSQAQQQIVEDGGKIFASSMEEAKQLWADLSISIYEDQNLARRKQQSESYLLRQAVAARASSVVDTVVPSAISRTKSASSASDSVQATVRQQVDLAVTQVSKLFSEQQCVDAVRSRSDRLQQQSIPAEKNESEIRKEEQLSRRLCDELRAKYESDRYKRMLVSRQQLPAFQQQEKIISDIRSNRVTLVVGDTGSSIVWPTPSDLREVPVNLTLYRLWQNDTNSSSIFLIHVLAPEALL